MTTFPILMFVRGALVLALALLALRLLRRAPAALRHAVLVSAMVAVPPTFSLSFVNPRLSILVCGARMTFHTILSASIFTNP